MTLYYDEIASSFTRIQKECKNLIKASKDEGVKERWGGRVAEAIREHSVQEKELY